VEQQYRESQERLELVLEVTSAGAWDWNVETGAVFFSNYWKQSLGYTAEEVPPTALFWESLIHPDDLPRVRRAVEEHFAGRTETYECVNRLRRKDGTWRWNLDRGRLVKRTPEGKPLRMLGTDSDLSAQRWSGLRELIPICAGCKRIRRDDGHWEGLEKHFSEGSRAQFTHGLCEECIRRYYGNEFESG
jgi:PAS domain S-box-containing protein